MFKKIKLYTIIKLKTIYEPYIIMTTISIVLRQQNNITKKKRNFY